MADRSLVVHEIYKSIQGESSFAGQPCTFIRLTGCNLRCAWCDTPHAFHEGTRMSMAAIVEASLSHCTDMVEVTGGEPLLQTHTTHLLAQLCDEGKQVLLETSGERDISGVDSRVHRIVDFKAPLSGESHRNRWSNVECLTLRDEVKFVIQDRADYDWAKDVLQVHDLNDRVNAIWLSPVHGVMRPELLVAWMLEDRLKVRVQLQIHKYIWGQDARGV
ncbi:MAG: radical SAM protein [Myxococcales bacterium]|nr:radical SAM protein [Myxococcales bacterium]